MTQDQGAFIAALTEYDIAAGIGTTATEIAAGRKLAQAVRDYLAGQSGTWTVLGIWDNDEAVPVGAVPGRHSVHGESPGDRLHDQLLGDPDFCGFDTSSFYEQGVWNLTVTAPSGDAAQDLAVREMMAALDHDEGEDNEECLAGTCRHPHEPGDDLS